uniref:Sas10 C-terminal domain-containing protein n=1 Tax=Ciona savignyi TaxID=51511 RepID=H2ZK95_CIOSA
MKKRRPQNRHTNKKKTLEDKTLDLDQPDPNSEDYFLDEVDKFHANQDKLLLNNNENSGSEYDDTNSEQGVLDISDDDSDERADEEDEESSPDESDADSDHGIPSSKAWGKKKSTFYGAESLEGLQGFDRDEAADLEEEEALRIQRKLNEEVDQDQFELIEPVEDSLTQVSSLKDSKHDNLIRPDFSNLSCQAQWKLISKESPELRDLIKDFKLKCMELRDRIYPLLELVSNGTVTGSGAVFIHTKFNLYTSYLINVSFYLSLKCKSVAVRNHPVIKRLVEFRTLINELTPLDEELEEQVDRLLQGKVGTLAKLDKTTNETTSMETAKTESQHKLKELGPVDSLKYFTALQERLKAGDNEPESEPIAMHAEFAEKAEERRAINYTMSKNKGAHSKRRKLDRNPRVKHREMYRKAKIRRRGQVRTYKPEINKYAGEASGIRAGVIRGVRIR